MPFHLLFLLKSAIFFSIKPFPATIPTPFGSFHTISYSNFGSLVVFFSYICFAKQAAAKIGGRLETSWGEAHEKMGAEAPKCFNLLHFRRRREAVPNHPDQKDQRQFAFQGRLALVIPFKVQDCDRGPPFDPVPDLQVIA